MFSEHIQCSSSISHTMLMINRQTKSPTLQNRVARLPSFSLDEYIQHERQEHEKPQNASESLLNAISVRLWRLVQSALLGRTGIEGLKSFDGVENLINRSLNGQEILDQEGPGVLSKILLSEEPMENVDFEEALLEDTASSDNLLSEDNASMGDISNQDLLDGEEIFFGTEFSCSPVDHLHISDNRAMHSCNVDEDLFGSEQNMEEFDVSDEMI